MSTLLLGLNQPGVTGRLWSASAGQNAPPQSFDASIGYPGVWDVRATSEDEMALGFQNVADGAVRVWLRKAGYLDEPFDTVMPDDGAKEIRLTKKPMGAIVVVDRDFMVDGRRYVVCEHTNFSQFYRFKRQEAMEPTLYSQDSGVEIMDRVTLSMKWIPEQMGWPALDMCDDPAFQPLLRDFLTWHRSTGRRLELTVVCDRRDMGKDMEWAARLLNQTYEVAQDFKENLVEFGNEVLDGEQMLDLPYLIGAVNRRGVTSCSGSGLTGGPVPYPYLDYCAPHLVRESLGKMMSDGNFGEQVYSSWPEHPHATMRAMLVNEMKGAGETDSGSRYTDANIAKECARIFRSRGGGCFHSNEGVYSLPLGPRQEASRAAFVHEYL